jgi:hypothetical protein
VREDILNQSITISQYKIYRNATPFFTPGGGNYLGSVADTTYLDVGATGGSMYFYVVQAYMSGLLSPTRGDGEGAVTRPEQGWIPRQLDER